MAMLEALLKTFEFVHWQTAQRSDLLSVTLGHSVDGQPEQRAIKAQGANVGRLLFEPPGTQCTSAFLLSAEGRSEERRVGKSVSVRVDLGGRRIIKEKKMIQSQLLYAVSILANQNYSKLRIEN